MQKKWNEIIRSWTSKGQQEKDASRYNFSILLLNSYLVQYLKSELDNMVFKNIYSATQGSKTCQNETENYRMINVFHIKYWTG